jgi:hypothetical protein
MPENTRCQGSKRAGKLFCSFHNVELVTQSSAREKGLTLDQPALNAWVCPKSGAMFRPTDEIFDQLEKS